MKKNRSTLKDYFKKGAIPTESNFSDLIDSMLNQEEDNVSKLPNDPLKIIATGTDEALLNFYRIDQNEAKLSWQVKQKPGGNAGLGIADASSTTYLFVESGTGNVNLGATKPVAKLDILQEARSGTHPTAVKGLYVTGAFAPDSDGVEFRHSNGSQGIGLGYNTIYATGSNANQDLGLKPRGTGKVSVTSALQVTGGLQVNDTGTSSFAGNLGLGTTTPKHRLDVQGRINVENGVIQRGGTAITTTSDLGLYSTVDKNWIRIVNTNAFTRFFADGGTGTNMELSVEKGQVIITGNLGIGTTTPRSKLDTGTGVLTGAANDYVKAQFTMSGGGTVTWGGSGGRLKWTVRFIAISMEKSVSFASGYVDIVQPTADIPAAQVYDGKARSATADGVLLTGWEALYAVHTVGGDNGAVSYQIVRYTNNITAPSNWILVAVANGDDNTVKLGTGVVLTNNSSSSQSSPIPKGVILMWSGATNNLPGGWVLCDGNNGTPNLKDRFIVAAGGNYTVGATGGADTVTLSVSQMPSHTHNNGDYKYLLRKTGGNTTDGVDNSSGEPDVVNTGEIQSSGGGQAHENRPPYYALAYIMKL